MFISLNFKLFSDITRKCSAFHASELKIVTLDFLRVGRIYRVT